jgi:hypothetical protein
MTPHFARLSSHLAIVASCAVIATGCDGGGSTQPDSTVVAGSAELSWMPPVENTDGSALTDLAGYDIHYGSAATDLDQSITIKNPSLNRYLVENLSGGTWYFAVVAFNAWGTRSERSHVVSKTIS